MIMAAMALCIAACSEPRTAYDNAHSEGRFLSITPAN